MKRIISEFALGDMAARYVADDSGRVGLILVPLAMTGDIEMDKDCRTDSLVQLKLVGDEYPDSFGCGVTMRESATLDRFVFKEQTVHESEGSLNVITRLSSKALSVEHHLIWFHGCQVAEVKQHLKMTAESP